MYEKLMYKQPRKDNKVIFRLQDFTKNDNVNEDMFNEVEKEDGAIRLECQVIVLHREELDCIFEERDKAKADVEELRNRIMQDKVKINKLENEIKEKERAHAREKLENEKYNYRLLEEHTKKQEKLKKQHQKDIDKLKETHTNQLRAIGETHDKQLRKLRAQYTAKIDDAKLDLIETIDANDKARDKIRVEMLELKESHKQEVITLQNTHHKEVETLQHAHSDELQALRKQHTYDIDTLKQAIADNKEEHLIEVGKLNERHHVEVDEIRSSFLSLLTVEHAQDLSDFNDCGELPFYVKPFARGFLKKFNEFKKRKELNTPKKIVETYKLAPSRDE